MMSSLFFIKLKRRLASLFLDTASELLLNAVSRCCVPVLTSDIMHYETIFSTKLLMLHVLLSLLAVLLGILGLGTTLAWLKLSETVLFFAFSF